MIVKLQLERNNKGEITSKVSNYDPSQPVKDRTAMVIKDFGIGYDIMNGKYRELNDLSPVDRQSKDRKSFNSYQEPKSSDPDEAWRSNAVRPISRNRVISIAAHTTANLIVPGIQAQNEDDDEDKDSADVMGDLVEFSNGQSNGEAGFEKTFLYAVISALVNPAVILHTEFAKIYRTVKEKNERGEITEKQMIDELYSGFQDSIVPIEELFIADIYEENIQKQAFLIRRRVIDFSVAEAKYGDREVFRKHVRPGIQVLYAPDTGMFYEREDDDLHKRFVEEVIYYRRDLDLQIAFVNGILMDDVDEPNPRKDKKYPFAKTVYEIIENFFYGKSLVFKGMPDEESINLMYRMLFDGTLLQVIPPEAVFGDEEVNAGVMIPGGVTTFKENTKMQSIAPQSNLQAGMAMLEKMESSYSESSNDTQQSGQASKGPQTAYEIGTLEENARIQLGLFGKMIGFLIKDFTLLRISDIIQFLTVGDIMELEGDAGRMKFQSFLIPDRKVGSKQGKRRIKFDTSLSTEPMTEEEDLQQSFDMLDEDGGMDSTTQIYKVSPELIRKRKFKVKVTADVVTPPSQNLKKALNLEAYDRAIANPLADQEAIYRDLLLGSYETTKSDPDKYISKNPQGMMQGGAAPAQGGLAQALATPSAVGKPNNLMQKVV